MCVAGGREGDTNVDLTYCMEIDVHGTLAQRGCSRKIGNPNPDKRFIVPVIKILYAGSAPGH